MVQVEDRPGAEIGGGQRPVPGLATAGIAWLAAVTTLAAALVAAWVAPVKLSGVGDWIWNQSSRPDAQLRWLLAIVPGSIIVNHMVYLLSSRRQQFVKALGPASHDASAIADLYFARTPMLIRYLVPAVLSAVVTTLAVAALTEPKSYISWLWARDPSKDAWPALWGAEVLRGAALGFVGAYVYVLLMLTDRARRRDITTGLAVWAAAMPILGPLMGGVGALLIASGAGASQGSFTRDAVFFVAGMLPQQFAAFVQSGVRKMFQTGTATTFRALPLTMLRGVGPEVEARLQEEGIYDVSALAYASPFQLIRTTTYAPKQIADWIDEALLVATVPQHWDMLEKLGVTGAIDLAWYAAEKNRDSIPTLASEIKMVPALLTNVVDRLDMDAQVRDLRTLYWDEEGNRLRGASGPRPGERRYRFKEGILTDARERLAASVTNIPGVVKVSVDGDRLIVAVAAEERDAVAKQLDAMSEIEKEA